MDNDRFRQYVTSTAFNINLSANMITALEHVETCPMRDGRWWSESRAYLSARSALERRGLAVWKDSTGPHLTEAGQLVLKLCRLAGLSEDRQRAGSVATATDNEGEASAAVLSH